MKWSKKQLLFLSLALVITCSGLLVLGDETTTEVFTPTYDNAIKYLDNLTSKVWFKNDFFGLPAKTNYFINNFVKAVFWIAKMLFYIFGEIYKYLSDASNGVGKFIPLTISFSASLFNTLFKVGGSVYNLGAGIIGFLVLRALIRSSLQGKQFFATLFRSLVPVLFAMFIFTPINGKYVVQSLYDSTVKATDDVAKSVLVSVNKSSLFNSSAEQKNSMASLDPDYVAEETLVDKLQAASSSALLDAYFQETIWTAFKYINSDFEIDDNGNVIFYISKNYKQGFEQLVFYDDGNDDFQMGGEEKPIKFVGDKKEVKNKMMKAYWGKKFMYAISAIVDVIVLGIIIDLVALANFLLSLMFILLLLIGGAAAIIAMFPGMEDVLFEWAKKSGITLLLSKLMEVFGIIVLWLYALISRLIMAVGVRNYFLASVIKAIVIYMIFKNRDWFLSILAAGRLRATNNKLMNRFGGGRSRKSAQDKKSDENKLSRLQATKKAVKRMVDKPMKPLKKVGRAGAVGAVFASRRWMKDETRQAIGNKLGRMAQAGADQAKLLSARKDELAAKFSDIRSQANSGVLGLSQASKQRYQEYNKKAKELRESATAKRRQVAKSRNAQVIKSSFGKSSVLALKNRDRLQAGFANRSQKRANQATKERLQAERAMRQANSTTKPSQLKLAQRRQTATKMRIEQAAKQSAQAQRENAKIKLRETRMQRHHSTPQAIPTSVTRMRSGSSVVKPRTPQHAISKPAKKSSPQTVVQKSVKPSVTRMKSGSSVVKSSTPKTTQVKEHKKVVTSASSGLSRSSRGQKTIKKKAPVKQVSANKRSLNFKRKVK